VCWVDITVPPATIISILRTGQLTNFNTFVFNNDVVIAIDGTDGTETHYTSGATSAGVDTVENPGPNIGSAPPPYHDGLFPDEVASNVPSVVLPQPEVPVKAISVQAGRPSSSIVQATFQVKVAS